MKQTSQDGIEHKDRHDKTYRFPDLFGLLAVGTQVSSKQDHVPDKFSRYHFYLIFPELTHRKNHVILC